MSKILQSAPPPPYQKENGKWALDHFLNGARKEYGEYPDQNTAHKVWEDLNHRWQAEQRGGYVIAPKQPYTEG